MVNPYTVLEVEPTAAQDEVKRSYRALALRYHPDKAGPDGAEKFKEVQAAYEILSDPVKRQRYDQFGDAGDMIPEMVVVSRTVRCVSALVVWVSLALIVLFTAFLAVYCDGKLKSWNMVKVFSPLFILDFFMLVLSLPVLAAFWRGGVLVLLCVSCVIALTIIVPVGKDTNDSRTQNYLQWRVLLIPGYIFSVFTTIIGIIISFKDSCCWIRFIQQFAFPLFFALVACRADESITSSYFVVIGLPVYLFFGIMLFLSLWPLSCARCWMVFTQGAPAIAIIISASLVAKRLDYFHSHGTYDGIFTLSKALIPIFIVEGLMLLGLTIVLIPFCLVPNVTVSDPPESKVDSDEDPPPCEAEPTKESTKSPQEPKKELPQGDRASDID